MSNDGVVDRKMYAFKECFSGNSGEIVLKHLSSFCGDGEIIKESERMNCYMQGRLSVLREINSSLKQRGKNNG